MMSNELIKATTIVITSFLSIAGMPAAAANIATQANPVWEIPCNGMVQPISKKLKLRGQGKSTRLKDSILLCTKHVYEFSGKAGQRIAFRLSGSSQTWMILSQLKGERIFAPEHLDRVFSETREWNGILPADVKYLLTIVTAERTPDSYTLELKSN